MDVSISAVIAQVINFAIMFVLFSKFAAKPLAEAIENRRSLIKKLEHADEAYAQKIKEAEIKAEELLAEWKTAKEAIVAEAATIATKKQKEIISEGEHKAQQIVDDAEKRAATLQSDLEKNFEEWLKKTSISLVKKLLQTDKALESQYLDSIIKDLRD